MVDSQKEKPEHITHFEEREAREKSGVVEPKLSEKYHQFDKYSKIDQLWTTPFMEMDAALPENINDDLVKLCQAKDHSVASLKDSAPQFYSLLDDKGFYATTHYNLFDEESHLEFPEYKEAILYFEKVAVQQIRYYILKGWGVEQAYEVTLEGRCFGNVQETGARTYPHYHQDTNGVLVHYLQLGDPDIPHEQQMKVGIENSPRHGNHSVLFLDPRPSPNYPFWEKVHSVTPRKGLTLIHPNYLWHETNPWLGVGTRACIVVNFKIASHGYNELTKTFRS